MADEVTVAGAQGAPTAVDTAVQALQTQITDLEKQLKDAVDATSVSAAALHGANVHNDQLVEQLKAANDKLAAMSASAPELRARGQELVDNYAHALETNSPRTMAELSEMRALLDIA